MQKAGKKKEVREVTARDLREEKQNLHETGRREAVRSIVGCKSHEKSVPDSTMTLPRPRNAEEKIKNHQNGPHRVVLAIVGCDLGQKNAANLMEGVK